MNNSGLWSAAANWSGSTIADGIDSTANFVFGINADRTVNLDSARTIGNLVFTDASTVSSSWILANNGVPANTLTLATTTGTPSISVTTELATISLVLAGTQGFNKIGPNPLALSGANTYTGGTTVSAGILDFLNTASTSAGTGTGGIGTTTVAATGSLGLGVGGTGFFSSTDVDSLFANTLANVSMDAAAGVGIDTTAGAFQYDTNLSTTRSLTKLGANALTLTGTSSTGNVTVFGGTLTVTSGALNVGSGTILVGNGGAGAAVAFGISGGSVTANTLNIATVASSATSTASITGSASATFTNVQVGSSTNTGGTLSINTTGTVSLGSYLMGRDSGSLTASPAAGLVINGGAVTAASVAAGSGVAGRAADINIGGGSLTIGSSASTGAFLIGGGTGSAGYVAMTGGSLTYLGTDGLLLAPTGGIATATANLSISGATTTATLTGLTLNSQNSASIASSKLSITGGSLYLGSVGLVVNQPGTNVSATIGTATVGAFANWTSSAPIALTGTPATFKAADASNNPFNIILNGNLTGAGALSKTGNGTLTLGTAAVDSYAGATTVNAGTLLVRGTLSATTAVSVNNAGSTLQLDASDRIFNSAAVSLGGGTFATAGFNETVGTLTLNTGVSVLDLGDSLGGQANIRFAASGAQTWTGTLSVYNWTNGLDHIFFGSADGDASLGASQLGAITFFSDAGATSLGTASFTGSGLGEIAAVPEPNVLVTLAGGIGLLLGLRRRRLV